MKRMFGLNVKAVGVIQPAIPCLGNNWKGPPIAARIGSSVRNAPLDNRVADHADAVRIGDHDGAFEETGFLDPSRASHFPISVERPPASENGVVHRLFAAGEYRSNAGADRTFANLKLAFAGNERSVADGDTRDVSDGVKRSGSAVERNS